MGIVVALGERSRVEGFALAGAAVVPAEDAEAARRSWAGLGDDVEVVILSQAAASALGDRIDHGHLLCVVMDQ